ncbi:MAG: c-type cytochrome [Planctomycetes bacterium]|nr:c-type cytochrome [Planctomycetota bacterium]
MKRLMATIVFLFCPTGTFAQVVDAPLPARVAAAKMTLPPGFKATLFAGEPDVVQPIAFCFDDRGRLWVVENHSYPGWDPDPKKAKDRVLIFEEGENGAFSKRTVFADNLQNLSGINYGFGGIWLCSTPNLIFIPIKDDKPAGPPEIVLDGWSLKAGHNVFNSLTWGPDGWLYGCNGIIATSYVGRPGTPQKDRVPINCGVWRYHPTKKKFEAVAHGTTNPWGLDFDEHGEMFVTNCVIDHLWHIVPGGHYERMYGEDLNPHVYKLMPSICDHKHWGGGSWTSSRAPDARTQKGAGSEAYKVHSAAGGGHAHVGCMIYLGDNWPDRYRGGVFMCNLHGNRINHDILERNGSTYVARHAKDFMHANDPWFRGLALTYGPDGGVYVSDWTDTGECHNYKVVDRSNGRIFKITYGDVKPWKGDLAKLSDLELAKLQLHKNEWQARHARRLLHERAETGKIQPEAIGFLNAEFDQHDGQKSLRLLWILHCINELPDSKLLDLWKNPDELTRAWAIRFFFDGDKVANKLVSSAKFRVGLLTMARRESSAFVRLHLASCAQRVGTYRFLRSDLIAALSRDGDEGDKYVALMSWYGVEPLVTREEWHPEWWVQTKRTSPLLRQFIARRISSLGENAPQLEDLIAAFKKHDEPTFHRDALLGIQDGLAGRRKVALPKAWKDAYPILIESPLAEVRERALALAVQFGDERAFTLLRKIVPDRGQPMKERESALKTLLFQQKADLVPILHELLGDESLRGPAIRGLAAFDDAKTPSLLLKQYPKWNADEKSDAIQTLSARHKFALALLDAIDAKAIPRGDLNSYTIRQLQTLKSPAVADKLKKVVGEVREASKEKAKLMTKYKADLKPNVLKQANLSNGRALYVKHCANCHRLFGEGGDIGPDITGSQRTNLDYVLENVLDPSAIVPREYQVTVIETKKGRTLSGIVKRENEASVTLQTQNEQLVIPKGDIESRVPTKLSMMPEGTFEQMRIEEVRDLVGYLASPAQVELRK